ETLHDRPGKRDAADSEQLLYMKLQPDTEHEKDDAKLRELLGHRRVRHEPRRVRSDERTRQQVAHDRRQSEALGEIAEHQRRAEAGRDGQNQVDAVHRAIARIESRANLRWSRRLTG